jgi:hypothetical protein
LPQDYSVILSIAAAQALATLKFGAAALPGIVAQPRFTT